MESINPDINGSANKTDNVENKSSPGPAHEAEKHFTTAQRETPPLSVTKTDLSKRSVVNLKQDLQNAVAMLEEMPPQKEEAEKILRRITLSYDAIHVEDKDRSMYSTAFFRLSCIQLESGEAGSLEKGIENMEISADIKDMNGQQNYVLAKTYFRLQQGETIEDYDGRFLKKAKNKVEASLNSNKNHAGSLILREYITTIYTMTLDNMEKHIEKFIRTRGGSKELQTQLKYYQAKLLYYQTKLLGDYDVGRKELTKNAENIFRKVEKDLPSRDYRKSKSSMYLGFLNFDKGDFQKAKEYLLKAIESISGRTKETFVKLFRMHMASQAGNDSLDVKGVLNLSGKNEELIHRYFKHFGVDVDGEIRRREDEMSVRPETPVPVQLSEDEEFFNSAKLINVKNIGGMGANVNAVLVYALTFKKDKKTKKMVMKIYTKEPYVLQELDELDDYERLLGTRSGESLILKEFERLGDKTSFKTAKIIYLKPSTLLRIEEKFDKDGILEWELAHSEPCVVAVAREFIDGHHMQGSHLAKLEDDEYESLGEFFAFEVLFGDIDHIDSANIGNFFFGLKTGKKIGIVDHNISIDYLERIRIRFSKSDNKKPSFNDCFRERKLLKENAGSILDTDIYIITKVIHDYIKHPKTTFMKLMRSRFSNFYFEEKIQDAFLSHKFNDRQAKEKLAEKIELLLKGFQKGLEIIAENYNEYETFSTKHFGNKKDYSVDTLALLLRNRAKIVAENINELRGK